MEVPNLIDKSNLQIDEGVIPVKKFLSSSKNLNPVRFPNSRGIAPANYTCANNLFTHSLSVDAIIIITCVSVRLCVIGNTPSLIKPKAQVE